MIRIQILLISFVACLVFPLSGFAQIGGLNVVLTPPSDKYIEIVSCKDFGGSWQCVMRNKTNTPIDLHNFHAIGYDKDGVKEGSITLTENIDANGSVRVTSLASVGYAGNVRKVVITLRQ